MYYIDAVPNESGNYGNPSTTPYAGALKLPDGLLLDYLETMGFANLAVQDDLIAGVTLNTEAYEAYQEANFDEEPDMVLSDSELLLELAADFEERICLLELGVTL